MLTANRVCCRVQPARGKQKFLETSQHPCPRHNFPLFTGGNLKTQFSGCIKSNGNSNSLAWFIDGSSDLTDAHMQKDLPATITSRKEKQDQSDLACVLVDKPKAIKAMSKVAKWAAMIGEKQAAMVTSTSHHVDEVGPSATDDSIAVVDSTLTTSKDMVVDKSAFKPTTTPRHGKSLAMLQSRNDSATLVRKQKQPRSRKRKKPKQFIKHTDETAHLFNSAGFLMPSIPGIDSVMERLFDHGEIMSLGVRLHDSYYPHGEPQGGSFLPDQSGTKKRKKDDRS